SCSAIMRGHYAYYGGTQFLIMKNVEDRIAPRNISRRDTNPITYCLDARVFVDEAAYFAVIGILLGPILDRRNLLGSGRDIHALVGHSDVPNGQSHRPGRRRCAKRNTLLATGRFNGRLHHIRARARVYAERFEGSE